MARCCGCPKRCRQRCSTNCCAYVELLFRHAGFCGHRASGLARQLQQAVRPDANGASAGSALGSLVCFHQPAAQSGESFVLGWQRTVGLRQAVGAGSFFLAAQREPPLRPAAQRRTDCVALRAGSAAKSRLVSALKTFLKNSSVPLNKLVCRTSEGANYESRDHSSGNCLTGSGAYDHRPTVSNHSTTQLASEPVKEGTVRRFF